MSSNQFCIAYCLNEDMNPAELEVRAGNVARYVQQLHRSASINESVARGRRVGLLSWEDAADSVRWPQFASSDAKAALWINFPEHEAVVDGQPDVLGLSAEVTAHGADIIRYGAPFACMEMRNDRIVIVNDVLGLARLYQFDFDKMTVWATRPGLAHIFASVAVEKNQAAWAGMATLGWNIGGESHVGDGVQLPGSTRIVADPVHGVHSQNSYAEWIQSASGNAEPWTAAADGIARSMSVGKYFENDPIADLSGGKDSRVLAAAALRSGVTKHLRTLRTDHGEVETAEILVSLYSGAVEHEIRDVSHRSASIAEVTVLDKVSLAQRANEGALLPVTAVSAPPFRGFLPPRTARFNGHGGESLQGGALFGGRWKTMLESKGIGGAVDRLHGMVDSPLATSELARESAMSSLSERLEKGADMHISSAHGLLNYFYNSERMPFWASSFSNRSTLTPYYSSGLLRHVARTFWGESDFTAFHKEVLSGLIPEWASVPYYKPVGVARRATSFFWELGDWVTLKSFVAEHLEEVENFDPDRVRGVVAEIDHGETSKALEVALARFLWEASVGEVVNDINSRVVACQRELARV